MLKIGINGFGRIGRMILRATEEMEDVQVVAINGSRGSELYAHLFKYDSVHGIFQGEVSPLDNALLVNGREVKIFASRDPKEIPWHEAEVDIVIECTGKFKSIEDAGVHLNNGVKKVIISAPGKDVHKTIVMGVNEEEYDKDNHHVVSNASCTTNCLAPFAKVIDNNFKIVKGMMTTIHSYTNDQLMLDGTHKDFRRARAGAMSMIPTSTGAAKAVSLVLPQLEGKLNGMAMRVPTPNVSCVDLVVEVEKNTTAQEVNEVLEKEANGKLKGILGFTMEPLVSKDFNGNKNSSIIDGLSTMVMGENLVKVLSWYDNEMGYALRCIDLAVYMSKKGL